VFAPGYDTEKECGDTPSRILHSVSELDLRVDFHSRPYCGKQIDKMLSLCVPSLFIFKVNKIYGLKSK